MKNTVTENNHMDSFWGSFCNSKKALSRNGWLWQVHGAIIKNKWWGCLNYLLVIVSLVILLWVCDKSYLRLNIFGFAGLRIAAFTTSVFLLWRTTVIVNTLNKIYCLRKQESRITGSQIVLLIVIGLFLITFVMFINPNTGSIGYLLLGGMGGVLTWIFQDVIKSITAFFYLRLNGMLKIGDWIIVPTRHIDGVVKRIFLTTVTIENWDTTTTSFPTYILQAEHFQNQQNMLEGKTHGRQMLKTFIIDTGWIHPLTEKEVLEIKKHLPPVLQPYASMEVKVGKLNMTAFRGYVYQTLLNNPKVSHHPRLVVRWLEHVNEGMPLQLYAFITETKLDAYEWEQSKIIEQILEALPWFGLQLYQSTSGFDASNSNIYLSEKPAKYEKEYGG